MNDAVLVWLAAVLICCLTGTVVARTVVVERAAGRGEEPDAPFRRPPLARRLDLAGAVIAVLLVSAGLLRVVLEATGWTR